MARSAAYFGVTREQVDQVFALPVEFVGVDTAWLPTSKTPMGIWQIMVVRNGSGCVGGGMPDR